MLGQFRMLLLVVLQASVVGGPAATGHPMQSATACGIYAAAIAAARQDSTSVVVIDSTSAGVPGFAFMAYSGSPRTLAQQGLPLSDSVIQAFQAANEHREPFRACLETLIGVQPVSDDSIVSMFGRGHEGWTRFRARYQGVKRFLLVSRPLVLPDSSVLVYVAEASDWLAGVGQLFQLQRDADGQWMRKATAILWIS